MLSGAITDLYRSAVYYLDFSKYPNTLGIQHNKKTFCSRYIFPWHLLGVSRNSWIQSVFQPYLSQSSHTSILVPDWSPSVSPPHGLTLTPELGPSHSGPPGSLSPGSRVASQLPFSLRSKIVRPHVSKYKCTQKNHGGVPGPLAQSGRSQDYGVFLSVFLYNIPQDSSFSQCEKCWVTAELQLS